MGMPISSVGSSSMYQASGASNWQQRRQDFNTLAQDLQSGNLSGAQQAYAALTQNAPGGSVDPNSPLGKLGQALQAGDITGAQKAFATLKAARHGHHHHAASPQAGSSSTVTTPSPSSNGLVGSNISVAA